MNVRYIVDLDDRERKELLELTSKGRPGVRKVKRAQILLVSDDGWKDCDIAAALSTSTSTVFRTKRKLVEGGLEHALNEQRRRGGDRKLSEREEALLIATTCSDPPEGRCRWTLELLADEMVRLTDHDSLSAETVRRRLGDNELKPWQKRMWCIPKVDAEYVARMEDVLDLYTAPGDDERPVVSFDETPIQLIGEARVPIPAKPGSTARIDYEYKRNGTANLFVAVDVHRPGALYQAFPPDEARRILRRIEFHYAPKHASWLNMVEIEIGVIGKQCLDRRIPDKDTLRREVAAWLERRNREKAQIRWMFGVEEARHKLGKAYPQPRQTDALRYLSFHLNRPTA